MPVKEFYNVFHHNPMGWMIAVYFFLSGIACGTFLVSVVSRLKGRGEYQRIQSIGAYLTSPVLAAGLLFLLLDLGKPLRLWHLFAYFNPTSVASWGVWLVNIFFVVSLTYAYFTFKGDEEKSKRFALIGTPFAIVVSGYSGFILVQMKAHTLWHSALIPVLFSVSALASGIALVVLGAILLQVQERKIRTLGKSLACFIGLDLILVFVEVLTLLNGHAEAVEVAKLLLIGAYSFVFLGLYVILGLVVPLYILSKKDLTLRQEAIASVLVLIGIMAMRYAIVMGGQYYPLS
jgi:polysulfide reductase chain C